MTWLLRLASVATALLGAVTVADLKYRTSGIVLWPLKLLACAVAPLVALISAALALAGLNRRDPLAAGFGLLGALASIRYVTQSVAPHSGFEQAFEPGWQERIPAAQRERILARRWTPLSAHAAARRLRAQCCIRCQPNNWPGSAGRSVAAARRPGPQRLGGDLRSRRRVAAGYEGHGHAALFPPSGRPGTRRDGHRLHPGAGDRRARHGGRRQACVDLAKAKRRGLRREPGAHRLNRRLSRRASGAAGGVHAQRRGLAARRQHGRHLGASCCLILRPGRFPRRARGCGAEPPASDTTQAHPSLRRLGRDAVAAGRRGGARHTDRGAPATMSCTCSARSRPSGPTSTRSFRPVAGSGRTARRRFCCKAPPTSSA